jgi:uncharacterized protein YchJ
MLYSGTTTDLQIEANRKNAAASTGPNTPEGKSVSSRNAVSHGLFSTNNLIPPAEIDEFNQLAEAMQHDLVPEGVIEKTLAAEITRAAWRLRRCAKVEDDLSYQTAGLDPMNNPAAARTQIAVDRARLETHRILKRSMDELRRLQNERRFRIEVLPEGFNTGDLGLASYKDLMPAMVAEKRWDLLKRQLEGLGSFESMIATAVGPQQPTTEHSTKQTHSTHQTQRNEQTNTPRNAPCPCGSGQKHKRCCGKNAAPVLHSAAA